MEHLETSPDPLPADALSPEAGQSPTSLLNKDFALQKSLSKTQPGGDREFVDYAVTRALIKAAILDVAPLLGVCYNK